MEDLLYFTFSKLLVKVEYSKQNNTLSYSSHREMTKKERAIIENYILTKVAEKTDYYKRDSSSFVYTGKEDKLNSELKLLRLKRMLKSLAVREETAKKEVDDLINSSFESYYFDRIGDTLLQMREQLKEDEKINLITIEKTKSDFKELVKAYNVYSDNKISLERAVPADLKNLFEYN
ncbi:hypothetical protein H8E88_12740 [candidate division KSB1 bacterium]|nr:hypothetical protein [candidate division KSB1 bacterium]